MPVPSYEQFIEPLLQFLGDKVEPVPARDAHEAAANMLSCDPAVLVRDI